MRSCSGQVVVVTGASAGVGRAVAEEFGRRGAAVALLARGEAGLDGAVQQLQQLGGEGARVLAVPVDVADAEGVEAAAERVESELGPIDVWVNDAMTTVFAPSWEVSAEEYRRATEVTYLGQVHGTIAALRRMRPRDRGTIVNVGSALAFRSIALQAPYCAAKSACRGFTEAVRVELLHERSRVQVAMVHLPAVNTPQFGWCRNLTPRHPRPVPPVYAPSVAGRHIVDVALRPRRQKLVGSFNTFLVWANKLAPGVVDHFVARTTVESQQADPAEVAADPAGPDNLWDPVDGKDGRDHGAGGAFGELEGGMLTRRSLAAIPGQVEGAFRAIAARLAEVARSPVAR